MNRGRVHVSASTIGVLLALGFSGNIIASLMPSIERSPYVRQGTFPPSRLPRICVSIHPSTASGTKNLALLQEVGATCARSDGATWEGIETSKGIYNWASQDSFWLPICRAGLSVIMVPTYNNTLYAPSIFRPIAAGANTQAFVNFAVAMADHYASRCPGGLTIEVFNEPNLPIWTSSQWTGSQYAPVLAAVSSAVKAAQPRVKVYSGGVSPGPGTQPPNVFAAEMTRAARFPHVDAYGVHPYNYSNSSPLRTPPPEQILIDLAAFRDSLGRDRKPIANTEYGFPYHAVGNDLALQARYVARAMLATITGGYPLYTQYDLIDDGTDYSNGENTFGLVYSGKAKPPYGMKPAGVAFEAVTRAMAGTKSYRVAYDVGQHVITIAFTKSAGKAFAIETWDADGPKSFLSSIGRFSTVTCQDVLGNPYACSYSDGKLSMMLTAASGPVIVTAR